MSDSTIPPDLRYTADHEWVKKAAGRQVRVGITDFAQEQLGDIVYVELPSVGDTVQQGTPYGEVESTKSVSDLVAPLTASVVAVNSSVVDQPDLINTDPYGEGWLVELEVAVGSGESATDALLDADEYRSSIS